MSMRKTLVAVLVATGVVGAVAVPALSQAAPVEWSIRAAPPPLRYEVIPRSRRGYNCLPHHWVQRGDKWHLNRGRWDRDGIPDYRDRHPYNPYRP